MQRINIQENDLSRNYIVETKGTGAVFIPGFVSTTAGAKAKKGDCIECNNESEFKEWFGTSAPTFAANQPYPTKTVLVISQEYATAAEMNSALKITNQVVDAEVYNPSTELPYNVGTLCLYKAEAETEYSLYICTKSTQETFKPADWKLLLTNGGFIKVKQDETKSNATSAYTFTVTTTTAEPPVTTAKVTYKQEITEGFPEVAIPAQDGEVDAAPMYKLGDKDLSWCMAHTLVKLGMPVVYMCMNDTDSEITVLHAYKYMAETVFAYSETNPILDKGVNITYITSGGYPTLEHTSHIDDLMIALATYGKKGALGNTGRGDCVALLDHTNNPQRHLTGSDSIFEHMEGTRPSVPLSTFASVFTPWCGTSISDVSSAPGSFVYLYNMVQNVVGNNNWAIYAGVSRGKCSFVTSLLTNETLTNRIAEYYQNQFQGEITHSSINPITYIRNYGYCIWGNRTCERYVSQNTGFSLSFLNVRNLVSAVKKQAYYVAQSLMFDNNDSILWSNFRVQMSTLLDQMKASGALKGYTYTRLSPSDLTALEVEITLYPAYGVESMSIFVNLENNAETEISE